MKYLLDIGMTGKKNHKPTLRDINIAIDSLDTIKNNPFIRLESSEAIENIIYIQVLCYNKSSNNINLFAIEVHIHINNGCKQYKYITADKNEVKDIFRNYFISQQPPNYSSWEDITDRAINQKKYSNTFFVYELVKNYYRNNKNIHNCYGYCHGNIVDGFLIFQTIAEAIVLLKDVVNTSNQLGDIYFSDNKKIYL